MQALLDLIFAVEGSVSDAAKYLGYLIYALRIIYLFIWVSLVMWSLVSYYGIYDLGGHLWGENVSFT